jgi:osmotically-inducible protein OsmY
MPVAAMTVRGCRRLITLLALATLLIGCRTLDMAQLVLQERQYAEDRLIAAEIRGELAARPQLDGARIDVDVYLKQVTLAGRAQPAQALLAVRVAEGVPLVVGVADRMQRSTQTRDAADD